jgi:histidinol-phosphate aminotransferase
MTVRIPEHLRTLIPYVPGKPIEEVERQLGVRNAVKLASNENPLGPSPHAIQAIRESAAHAHRYPDGGGFALRTALSARFGVEDSQIVLGNGSTELVELAAKAFLSEGSGAVVADQAFIMYRIAVQAMNAPLRLVPLVNDRHDLRSMASQCGRGTALVYIANPNNPTGTYVGRAEFEEYFARVPDHVLTILDEAYIDYVEAPDFLSGLDMLKDGRNVVILHTFSKIHGLAGVRIGYALARKEIAAALEAVRSPFNTSVPAQAAALAALDDTDHIARSRSGNRAGVQFLEEELRRRRVEFVPTVANFLLIRTRMGGQDLYERLLRLGVIVRPMGPYGYQDAIRVSIGTRDELHRFLAAFDTVMAQMRAPSSTSGGAT